jgi:rhodanese-related sulfurtransferase
MKYPFLSVLVISLILPTVGVALDVKITLELESVKVIHNGRAVIIQRNQNQDNMINPEFAKTSRPCPPFCIKPITLAPGVETIIELEMLDYLKQKSEGDRSILVIDSRTADWAIKGSIPGTVNIPWDILSGVNTSSVVIQKLLEEQFDVKISKEGKYLFDKAKTLILFCNGPWCDQSPANIKTLLTLGYPPEKLKWYRDGMQSWESLGLTTVTNVLTPQSNQTGAIDFIKAKAVLQKEVAKKSLHGQLKDFFTTSLWGDSTTIDVKITPQLDSVEAMHNGKFVIIQRNQNQNNTINPEFAKTSRPCPPSCLRAVTNASSVEIIAELEVLNYLERMSEGDNSILIIDSRRIDWVVKGSIPGSVSIPWDILSAKTSTTPIVKKLLIEQIGVKIDNEGKYCFKKAKTLVLFCNGPWCDKSHTNVETLLELGYPPNKLKWYRGGMQSWESFGLTTVTDIPMPWFGL